MSNRMDELICRAAERIRKMIAPESIEGRARKLIDEGKTAENRIERFIQKFHKASLDLTQLVKDLKELDRLLKRDSLIRKVGDQWVGKSEWEKIDSNIKWDGGVLISKGKECRDLLDSIIPILESQETTESKTDPDIIEVEFKRIGFTPQ